MKIYRRELDNFEVQDVKDRPVEWVVENFGSGFVEVLPPKSLGETELAAIVAAKKNKKDAVLSKLKITQEDLDALMGV